MQQCMAGVICMLHRAVNPCDVCWVGCGVDLRCVCVAGGWQCIPWAVECAPSLAVLFVVVTWMHGFTLHGFECMAPRTLHGMRRACAAVTGCMWSWSTQDYHLVLHVCMCICIENIYQSPGLYVQAQCDKDGSDEACAAHRCSRAATVSCSRSV